jgi:uncharacterized protein
MRARNYNPGSTSAADATILDERASLVFDDPHHLTRQDREVDGEPRWQTIGIVNGIPLPLVAHTVDEDEELIRILSARKATRRERSTYAQIN